MLKKIVAIKRTSDQWHEHYKKKFNMQIVDPDGWDRENYTFSWFFEKIIWDEFMRRCLVSTQMPIKEKRK